MNLNHKVSVKTTAMCVETSQFPVRLLRQLYIKVFIPIPTKIALLCLPR